jgi:hypothetical protein
MLCMRHRRIPLFASACFPLRRAERFGKPENRPFSSLAARIGLVRVTTPSRRPGKADEAPIALGGALA